MSPPSIHLLEKLSTRDIKKLTELLRLSPRELTTQEWLADQAARISNLPSSLLKPNDPLLRLGMSFKIGPEKATLCKSHKNLNPYLIRMIFLQIYAECTTRLARLRQKPFLDGEVESHVKRLQILNSLWMSPDLFRVTFQVMPQEPRYFRVPGDSEACILATVGGSLEVLCDLRVSMLGRKKKKRAKEPRLLKIVEAWMRRIEFNPRITRDIDAIDAIARRVRACRRDMQLARRQTKRNRDEGIPDTDPSLLFEQQYSETSTLIAEDESKGVDIPDEEGEDTTVNDIINHYTGSIHSFKPLLGRPIRADDMHPAYRISTTISKHRPPIPRPAPTPSISTSYASNTTIRPRLSTETLSRFDDDFSPRPQRPQNRSTYMDSLADTRMSRASAEVPPLRPHQQPAYTESVYSSDMFGRATEDARSFNTAAATVNNSGLDAALRARTYEELLRRQEEEPLMGFNYWNVSVEEDEEEEVDVPPIPRCFERRVTEWSQFAGHRAPDQVPRRSRQDGW